MAPDDPAELGAFIRERREALGISQRELMRRTRTTNISRIEQGTILPATDTLRAIAETLGLSLSELVAAGRPSELPTLRPYLRAKYHDLDDDALFDLERYAERLIARHGGTGPVDHEDEAPGGG